MRSAVIEEAYAKQLKKLAHRLTKVSGARYVLLPLFAHLTCLHILRSFQGFIDSLASSTDSISSLHDNYSKLIEKEIVFELKQFSDKYLLFKSIKKVGKMRLGNLICIFQNESRLLNFAKELETMRSKMQKIAQSDEKYLKEARILAEREQQWNEEGRDTVDVCFNNGECLIHAFASIERATMGLRSSEDPGVIDDKIYWWRSCIVGAFFGGLGNCAKSLTYVVR